MTFSFDNSMMRQSLYRATLLVLCALSFSCAKAQDVVDVEADTIRNADGSYTIHTKRVKSYKVKKKNPQRWEINGLDENWMAGISAGGALYFGAEDGEESFGKRLTPYYEVMVGKWIYPFFGIRAAFGFGSLTGFSTKKYDAIGPGYYDATPYELPAADGNGALWRQHWTYKAVRVDFIYDLGSKKHFDPTKFYHCRGVFGAGITWGDNELYSADKNRIAAFYLGLNHSFRINRWLQAICETRYVFTNNTFDRERTNLTFPGYLNVTAGLAVDITGAINQRKSADEWRYSESTTTYNEAVDTYVSEVQKVMGGSHLGKQYVAPTAVFFELDKYELLPEYKLTLQLVARQLKASGLTMQLVGSADRFTGKEAHNQWLSEKRCEAVKNYLVRECGIAAEQLQVKPIGGIEEYSIHRLNRAVFILLENAPQTKEDALKIINSHQKDESK